MAETSVDDEGVEEAIDRAVLTRVAEGDAEALGTLFDRHAASMLGIACRVLGNRSDAEDLVHDVFVEVAQKAGDYDSARGRVRPWLMVRVRSRAIDRLRSLEVARRARRAQALEVDATSPPSSRPEQEDSADGRRARAAMAALSREQAAVVELAYFAGCSMRDIAERLEIPIGTVKSRLSAALSTLRSVFHDEIGPDASATSRQPSDSQVESSAGMRPTGAT